jgi:hypothetical protein
MQIDRRSFLYWPLIFRVLSPTNTAETIPHNDNRAWISGQKGVNSNDDGYEMRGNNA